MLALPPSAGCRSRFAIDGYVVVPRCVDDVVARSLAETADAAIGSAARRIDRRTNAGAGLAYKVVTGDVIKSRGAALFTFFASADLLAWIREVTGCPQLSRSNHLRSAININCLTAPGEQYPLHFDAVPFTALLFLSTVPEESGGAFLIHSIRGEEAAIQPELGSLILMDGARCRHGAAPLRRSDWRVTMPMVFPAADAPRPVGLDETLYGTEN